MSRVGATAQSAASGTVRTLGLHGSHLLSGVGAALLVTVTWLARLDRAVAAATMNVVVALVALAATATSKTIREARAAAETRTRTARPAKPARSAPQPPKRAAPLPQPRSAQPKPAQPKLTQPKPTPTQQPARKPTQPKLPAPVVRAVSEPITDDEVRELLQPSEATLPPRRRVPRVRSNVPASETFRSALDSLSSKKLRSALTMLGIVIGVGAVIVLVALGNGMKADFNKQFSRLANQITVTQAGKSGNGSAGRNLTDTDVAALSDHRRAPSVASVSPSMSGDVTLTVGQNQERAAMVGAMSNYLDLLDRKIVAGRWLTDREVADRDRVAVLGPQAVAMLWGRGAPSETVIGSKVRIEHSVFTVAGILDSDGQNDNVVIVPFGAARSYLIGDNAGEVNSIVVKSTDVSTVALAAKEIVAVLDDNHHIKKATDRDFNVLTYTNLLNKSNQFVTFLSQFIVAIAAVSLLVGGIGVANIMLVSVTERTREIGIRKAIGATSQAILRQFLSEAVMLTGLGGLVGVGLGVAGSYAGQNIMPKLVTDFPGPILSIAPVFVAFGVSLAIGLVAGGYPAYRAARMKPIDALRWE